MDKRTNTPPTISRWDNPDYIFDGYGQDNATNLLRLCNHHLPIRRERTYMEFKIPQPNISALMDKIIALNKRATRMGCPPIAIFVTDTLVEKDDAGNPMVYEIIELNGDSPSYNGWKLLGTLQNAGQGKNTIRSVPGKEIPPEYSTADPYCDHCNSKRNRKNTFIIQHEDGLIMQVGSSCIKEFLGHADPESLARYVELLIDSKDLAYTYSEFKDVNLQITKEETA